MLGGMANDKALDRPSPTAVRYINELTRSAEIAKLDDEDDALAYAQEERQKELRREQDQRSSRIHHLTQEGLELMLAMGSGGLAAVRGGPAVNYVVGGVAKVASAFVDPPQQTLRTICRAGKTLLHGQMAIHTRDWIRGNTP